MRPEIAARAAQSLQAFNIYRNKVYSNPRIDIPTRFKVLQATALATLHYGSGTWSRLTANELKVWNTTHFTLYRKLLYKLFAFEDIRHMTDDEILVKVQQVHPTITLQLQRLHWYGSMLTRTCPNFWAIMAYEKWWIQCVTDDLDWLFQQIVGYTWLPNPRDDLDAWHLYAIQFPNRWKKLLKRARLHAIWQHTVHFNVHRYHRKAFDLMVAAGAQLPKTLKLKWNALTIASFAGDHLPHIELGQYILSNYISVSTNGDVYKRGMCVWLAPSSFLQSPDSSDIFKLCASVRIRLPVNGYGYHLVQLLVAQSSHNKSGVYSFPRGTIQMLHVCRRRQDGP